MPVAACVSDVSLPAVVKTGLPTIGSHTGPASLPRQTAET